MGHLSGRIRGHNNEWAAVTRIKDIRQNIIGWQFQTKCSKPKIFLDQYYHDPYSMAVAAMESHKHG